MKDLTREPRNGCYCHSSLTREPGVTLAEPHEIRPQNHSPLQVPSLLNFLIILDLISIPIGLLHGSTETQ